MHDPEGGAASLIERAGGNVASVCVEEADAAVERLPKVSGTSGDVQVGRDSGARLEPHGKGGDAARRRVHFDAKCSCLALADADLDAELVMLAAAGVTKKLLERGR